MGHKRYLKEFVFTQIAIEFKKHSISPKQLYNELMQWARLVSASKDIRILALYDQNLQYFDRLEIEDYHFEPLWYNLKDLVEYDFLNPTPVKLDQAVAIVSEILWELVAFKSERNCKLLRNDNLRVLTDASRKEIIFCCDRCSYTENMEGIKIDAMPTESIKRWYPATKSQISNCNIQPASC